MVERIDIERALQDLISNEETFRFQGLAVALAQFRWRELIACERHKDHGLDAYASPQSAPNGVGKGLSASITPTSTSLTRKGGLCPLPRGSRAALGNSQSRFTLMHHAGPVDLGQSMRANSCLMSPPARGNVLMAKLPILPIKGLCCKNSLSESDRLPYIP
jgi:hypothetical protein